MSGSIKLSIVEQLDSVVVNISEESVNNNIEVLDGSNIRVNITDIPEDIIIPDPIYINGESTVVNSDQTYLKTVLGGNTLYLPDITHTDSDGSSVVLPAQTPFVATQKSGIAYAYPQKTFQATSYKVGDAAWNEANLPADVQPTNPLYIQSLADNYTLTQLNEFGNYYRYTDQSGVLGADALGIYSTDTLIDHYTGREWAINDKQTGNNKTWDEAIDECLDLNSQGFDDWYLPTYEEWVANTNINGNYATINNNLFGGGRNFWTSNTDYNDTTRGVIFNSTSSMSFVINRTTKTATLNYIPVRKRY